MFIYFSKKDLFLFTFVLTFCNTSVIHWQMNRDYFVLTSYCSPYHSDLLLRVRLVLLNCYSDKLLFMDFLLLLVLLLSLLAALLPLVWLVIWTWLHNKILETRFWRIVLFYLPHVIENIINHHYVQKMKQRMHFVLFVRPRIFDFCVGR